jgi:hypothetical protein
LVNLAHPIDGVWRQCVIKRDHHSHILASLGEGGELLLRVINNRGLARLECQFALVQVGQSGLNSPLLIGKLAPSLHGFMFDVVL